MSVKCTECGFLSIRHTFKRHLVEAEAEYRETANLPPVGDGADYQLWPCCFVAAYDLRKELSDNTKEEIVSVISKSRDCNAYTRWKPNHSPKEHQEMLDRQWMLDFQAKREDADRDWRREVDKADRVWRERQADADKAWRERQAKDERDWREKQYEAEERRHRANLIVMGLLAILAALVGSAIEANWIPNAIKWCFGVRD